MTILRDNQIDVIKHPTTPAMDIRIALVTTRGRVYACTYAPMDEPLTKQFVKQQWVEDRRSFRPYDTTEGRYLS